MRFALELVLTFAPFAVLLALLVHRCFPGEGAILRHRLRSVARRLRAPKVRWRRQAARTRSALTRAAVSLRGPPSLT